MPGRPKYSNDFGEVLSRRKTTDEKLFTDRNTRRQQYWPHMPLHLADTDTSHWPDMTGTTWTNLKSAQGANTHPLYSVYYGILVPAGGSQIRVLASDFSTVLAGPVTISYTTGKPYYYGFHVDISSLGLERNAGFFIVLQGRSISPGQPTYATITGAWGVDPDDTLFPAFEGP